MSRLSTPRLPPAAAALLTALLLSSTAGRAEDFPPISAAERDLTQLADFPDAPAVVLAKRAELRLRAPGSRESSILDVRVRIKILREDGIDAWSQVSVAHGDGVRLEGFAGRTVLPDGHVLPVAESEIFTEQRSRARERFVTKAAFPGVVAGALIDYRFTLRWDSLYFLQPWTFDHPVPTLLAELVYHEPPGMHVEHWGHTADGEPLLSRSQRTLVDRQVTVWRENLPPIVDQPFAPPLADRSTFVLVVPRAVDGPGGERLPLLDSWAAVCRAFEEGSYHAARAAQRNVRKKARELTRDVDGDSAKVERLHAFVRDEIRSLGGGVHASSGRTVDDVLAEGGGAGAEKALLLQALLEAVKIPARLVWAADWRDGEVHLEVPMPGWFDRVLVLTEGVTVLAEGVTAQGTLLDPDDRRLAAGRLAPTVEGTRAVLVDAEAPRLLTLPSSPPEANARRAGLDLALDPDGRLSGGGRLELRGHHAWFFLLRRDDPEAVRDAWRAWLENAFPGFEVEQVEVAESVREARIDLRWQMAQRPGSVLGDEADLLPSRPLGPVRQRYAAPPAERRAPVRISFADLDVLELRLGWPAGWELDLQPRDVRVEGLVGRFAADLEVDDDARRLIYRRRVEIVDTLVEPGAEYTALRDLYDALERHDAQDLVLVRAP